MEVFKRNLDLDMFYKNNIYTMYENIQLNEPMTQLLGLPSK